MKVGAKVRIKVSYFHPFEQGDIGIVESYEVGYPFIRVLVPSRSNYSFPFRAYELQVRKEKENV